MSACIWNWPSRGGEDREASQASLGGEGARLSAPAPTIGIGGGRELDDVDAEGARKGEGGERTRVGVVGVGTAESVPVELADGSAWWGGKSASLGRIAGARRTYEGGATTLLATSYVETEP